LKQTQETAHQHTATLQHNLIEQTKLNASRFSYKKILSQASEVWQDSSIAESMATEASQIIKTIHKRNRFFFSGKSEKGLLSGLFYLLSIKNKVKKTQREIARRLNTNDVTVRASYRDWLHIHPELCTATKLTNDSLQK